MPLPTLNILIFLLLSPVLLISQFFDKDKSIPSNEIFIAGGDYPRSDIAAVISKGDTSIIITACIATKNLNGITREEIEIYYSNNFGEKWQEGNLIKEKKQGYEVIKIKETKLTSLNDGKYLLSWLELGRCYSNDNSDSIVSSIRIAVTGDDGKTFNEIGSALHSISPVDESKAHSGLKAQFRHYDIKCGNKSYYGDEVYIACKVDSTEEIRFDNLLFTEITAGDTVRVNRESKINRVSFDYVDFPRLCLDSNGVIHTAFLASEDDKNFIYYAVSYNAGQTFSREELISEYKFALSELIPNSKELPFSGIDRNTFHPSLCLNCTTGDPVRLYASWDAFGQSNTIKGSNTYVSLYDNFEWNDAKIVSDFFQDRLVYNSRTTVVNDTTIVVTYLDRIDDRPDFLNEHVFLSYIFNDKFDDASHFPVSVYPTNSLFKGTKNFSYGGGQYMALVNSPAYAIPIWPDGRRNDGSLMLFSAFLPIIENIEDYEPKSIHPGVSVKLPYPNSSDDFITLGFEINEISEIKATINDLMGRSYLTVTNKEYKAGFHQFLIDIREIGPGFYYFLVETELGFGFTKFLILR